MKKGTFTYFVYTCLVLLLCTTDIYGQLDVQQLTEQQGLGNNTIQRLIVFQSKKNSGKRIFPE